MLYAICKNSSFNNCSIKLCFNIFNVFVCVRACVRRVCVCVKIKQKLSLYSSLCYQSYKYSNGINLNRFLFFGICTFNNITAIMK